MEERNGEAGLRDLRLFHRLEAEGRIPAGGRATLDLKERKPAGKFLLIASKDLLAADTIAVCLMGQDPGAVKQLRIAARFGMGEASNIRLLGVTNLDPIRIRGLVRARPWQERNQHPSGAPEEPRLPKTLCPARATFSQVLPSSQAPRAFSDNLKKRGAPQAPVLTIRRTNPAQGRRDPVGEGCKDGPAPRLGAPTAATAPFS